MIFNMVGGGAGGAGGGATLVVSSPVNVSVTVSKDDKSYTKNSGSLGSTTFKGLATGTWTVTISGNGQTATRTIEITADYAITIAFFSATINITYPANSNCVVTNSGGQTVANDTNATSSTKTWTATVNATGTYTVTATATDGSGKSKIRSVEITTEGQSESVKLSYTLYLFKNGDQCVDVTGGWERNTAFYAIEQNKGGTVTFGNDLYFWTESAGAIVINTKNAVDISQYNTLNMELTEILEKCRIGVKSVKSGDIYGGDTTETRHTGVVSFDISGYTGKFWIVIGAQTYTGARIPRVWLS